MIEREVEEEKRQWTGVGVILLLCIDVVFFNVLCHCT